ncbi:MAG TPA: hypothetical protein VIS27_09575 [Yeosuana sp.]
METKPMSTFKHVNGAEACPKCLAICDTYPGINKELKRWFFEQQKDQPSFHISEAGRGKVRQNLLFDAGSSRAKWLESAHNYNVAIDTFFIDKEGKLSYDKDRYAKIKVPNFITWYGAPGSKFYERPHYQIKNWRDLLKDGKLKEVE